MVVPTEPIGRIRSDPEDSDGHFRAECSDRENEGVEGVRGITDSQVRGVARPNHFKRQIRARE